MSFRPLNPSGDDETCIWCGTRLRLTYQTRADADAGKPRERKGDYGDGLFCTLRCGYLFGLTFARWGKRISVSTAITKNP